MKNVHDLFADLLQRVLIEVDPVQTGGEFRKFETVLDPVGEIIGVEPETQARVDEMVVQRLQAHVSNALSQFSKIDCPLQQQHGDLSRLAEVKGFEGRSLR